MPFWFECESETVLSWYHEPHCESSFSNVGVIILPALHFEYVFSHRALEYLSCLLASQGFPVLRIDDYIDVDSSDSSEFFLAQTRMAEKGIEWLKTNAGCKKICAVGLRYGGAVLANLAHDKFIDSLVLWDPVVKGRDYVQSLKMVRQPQAESSTVGGFVAGGVLISEDDERGLKKIRLVETPPRETDSILYIYRKDFGKNERFIASINTEALCFEHYGQDAYAEFMAQADISILPLETH